MQSCEGGQVARAMAASPNTMMRLKGKLASVVDCDDVGGLYDGALKGTESRTGLQVVTS